MVAKVSLPEYGYQNMVARVAFPQIVQWQEAIRFLLALLAPQTDAHW